MTPAFAPSTKNKGQFPPATKSICSCVKFFIFYSPFILIRALLQTQRFPQPHSTATFLLSSLDYLTFLFHCNSSIKLSLKKHLLMHREQGKPLPLFFLYPDKINFSFYINCLLTHKCRGNLLTFKYSRQIF